MSDKPKQHQSKEFLVNTGEPGTDLSSNAYIPRKDPPASSDKGTSAQTQSQKKEGTEETE